MNKRLHTLYPRSIVSPILEEKSDKPTHLSVSKTDPTRRICYKSLHIRPNLRPDTEDDLTNLPISVWISAPRWEKHHTI